MVISTKSLSLICLLSACSHVSGSNAPTPYTGLPDKEDVSAYDSQYTKLAASIPTENGYVVSKTATGFDGEGDAALFTGIAAGSLPCTTAEFFVDTLTASMITRKGSLVRFEPPPGNATSYDMLVGVMFGYVQAARHCPNLSGKIAAAYGLNSGVGRVLSSAVTLTNAQAYTWEVVAQYFGFPESPASLETYFKLSSIATTASIGPLKQPCYPVHLDTLNQITLAKTGHPVDSGFRAAFCDSTKDYGLPLTDWYCERSLASDILKAYVPNKYIYEHQRCTWESADGGGEVSPGVDFLVIYSLASE